MRLVSLHFTCGSLLFVVASCTVVQWLSRPRRPGFDAHGRLCIVSKFFFILKRLRIVVKVEGGQRVYVGIRYPALKPPS